MQSVAYRPRPFRLKAGLKYVGKVTNDTLTFNVYANLPVMSSDAYHIEFAGGAIATEHGFITSGRKHGRILTIRHDHLGRRHSRTAQF